MDAPLGCILLIGSKMINGLIFQKRLICNRHRRKVIIRVESANTLMLV